MSPVRQSSTTQRARFLAEPARREALQAGVDRRAAAARRCTSGRVVQLADQPAARGDLDPRRAGPAAQPLLHHLLEPLLADLEAGRDQQRVAVLGLIFLGGWACRHSRSDGRPRRLPDSSARRRAAATTPGSSGRRTRDRGDTCSNVEMLGDRHRLEARGRARARRGSAATSSGGEAEDPGRASAITRSASSSRSGIRSTRKSPRLIAIGWPWRSTIQPRRGGISRMLDPVRFGERRDSARSRRSRYSPSAPASSSADAGLDARRARRRGARRSAAWLLSVTGRPPPSRRCASSRQPPAVERRARAAPRADKRGSQSTSCGTMTRKLTCRCPSAGRCTTRRRCGRAIAAAASSQSSQIIAHAEPGCRANRARGRSSVHSSIDWPSGGRRRGRRAGRSASADLRRPDFRPQQPPGDQDQEAEIGDQRRVRRRSAAAPSRIAATVESERHVAPPEVADRDLGLGAGDPAHRGAAPAARAAAAAARAGSADCSAGPGAARAAAPATGGAGAAGARRRAARRRRAGRRAGRSRSRSAPDRRSAARSRVSPSMPVTRATGMLGGKRPPTPEVTRTSPRPERILADLERAQLDRAVAAADRERRRAVARPAAPARCWRRR